jgi:hypothetical protein
MAEEAAGDWRLGLVAKDDASVEAKVHEECGSNPSVLASSGPRTLTPAKVTPTFTVSRVSTARCSLAPDAVVMPRISAFLRVTSRVSA